MAAPAAVHPWAMKAAGGGSFSAAALDPANTASGVQTGNGLVSFGAAVVPAGVPPLAWWAELVLVLSMMVGGR